MITIKWIFVFVSSIRLIPHYLLYLMNKSVIDSDISVAPYKEKNLFWLLTYHKDFRSLFYKRIGKIGYLLNCLARKQQDLFINSTLAQMGSSLLWNLFRNGMTENRGFFLNLKNFQSQSIKL